MDPPTRARLRSTFEQVPDLYDRARSAPPRAMMEDLARIAELSPSTRTLEIGCGPGTTTRPLAELGGEIVAVELGPKKGERARSRRR